MEIELKWLLGVLVTAFAGWNVWQEVMLRTVRERVTRIEAQDVVVFRELIERLAPMEEKLNAIAIRLGIEDDRRHHVPLKREDP